MRRIKHNSFVPYYILLGTLFTIGALYLLALGFNAILTPLKLKPVELAYNDSELRQRIETLEEIVGLRGELAQPTGLQNKRGGLKK